MAERRMFAKTIIDSDAFLDMPLSAQALYFHLSMRADDDGFLNNANKIMRMIGANKNDYDLLVSKRFIILFNDGICVIKHWRIHNYIRNDRYKETIYQEEKAMLSVKENKAYTINEDIQRIEITNSGIPLGIPYDNQMVYQVETQVRLGKDSIDKNNIKDIPSTCVPGNVVDDNKSKKSKAPKHKYGEYNHVLLTDTELEKLYKDFGEERSNSAITYLDEYIEMKGAKYKSHYLALRKWVFDAVDRNNKTKSSNVSYQTKKQNNAKKDFSFNLFE